MLPFATFQEVLKGVLKLLVFDLDGTLADTREDLAQSVNHALRQSGLPPLPLETVMAKVGNGARSLIRGSVEESLAAPGRPPTDAGEALVEQVLAAFLTHYGEHCLVKTLPYPGVGASLKKLGGYRMAVLTNKPTAPAARILRGLGLAGHFDPIIGGDNPYGQKPDPGALNWLMAKLGVSPRATAMIGDGVQDARAARLAGTSLIGFLGGIAPRSALLAESPDAVVESMAALPEAVARLEARLAGEAMR
jgi:phosphoglycolate phosphatase